MDQGEILATDEVVIGLTTKGDLCVFRTSGTKYDELARYHVANSPTWAHPTIVGKHVLIKDQASLTLWEIGN